MPNTLRWTAADMPDLTGRTAIVTGGNSGLGLETVREIARHGGLVTMAVRDEAKGTAAAEAVLAGVSGASIEVRRLDLADLASVREFAAAWSEAHPDGLDLLVNNAGIMAIPRQLTVDGFERQLGTNHLGHFALTGLLLPALVARPRSRVVTVSSQAHRMGRMDFDDLMGARRYRTWGAYGQSKLANLLFTAELQRRLDLAAVPTLAMAAHPGFAHTNLQSVGPAMRGSSLGGRMSAMSTSLLGQSAAMGALPTLFAATAPGLPGNSYVGPDGFLEQRGQPRLVDRSKAAKSRPDAVRLWEVSEVLTGVRYPLDPE